MRCAALARAVLRDARSVGFVCLFVSLECLFVSLECLFVSLECLFVSLECLFVCLFVKSLCLWWSRAQRPGPRRYVASMLGRSTGGTLGTHAWGSDGQCRLVTGALGHTVETHSTHVHTHTCPRTRPAPMRAWLVRTHAHTTSRAHMHTHSTGTHACTGILTRTHARTRIRTRTY
jgi:hypothetical protein